MKADNMKGRWMSMNSLFKENLWTEEATFNCACASILKGKDLEMSATAHFTTGRNEKGPDKKLKV